MKRLWFAAGLLGFLLALCLANGWYARHLSERLAEGLVQSREFALQGQWERAEEQTRQIYNDWQGNHRYLHIVMRHSDTDQILRSFRVVMEYLAIREWDQYTAANADLIAQIQLLAEMEQPSLVNVL